MQIYLLLLCYFIKRVCSSSTRLWLHSQYLINRRIASLIWSKPRTTSVIEFILSIRRRRKEAIRILIILIGAAFVLRVRFTISTRAIVIIVHLHINHLMIWGVGQCIVVHEIVWWKLSIANMIVHSITCRWIYSLGYSWIYMHVAIW